MMLYDNIHDVVAKVFLKNFISQLHYRNISCSILFTFHIQRLQRAVANCFGVKLPIATILF